MLPPPRTVAIAFKPATPLLEGAVLLALVATPGNENVKNLGLPFVIKLPISR
jgi:hypothetical protein